MNGSITDVPGIEVGHAQDLEAGTGCTVVLCRAGAVAGVDVRGGAPGTRETDVLASANLVERVHAVLLAGGSAFGLDAAAGVMRFLDERGIGFDAGVARVPLVPAAVIFDLACGSPTARPDAAMGYRACLDAGSGPVRQGNAGAGAGATVGKAAGWDFAMKGGLGSASVEGQEGLIVGAVVVVNCFGDVRDAETGQLLAGTMTPDRRKLAGSVELLTGAAARPTAVFPSNTTIAVVATNARLNKGHALRVAIMAQDGLARAIEPVHTMFDGDTVFCLSTGAIEANASAVGALAARVLARAVAAGVRNAEGLHGALSYRELGGR
jgi:L-aminopeptidase/D-esterase-like protein